MNNKPHSNSDDRSGRHSLLGDWTSIRASSSIDGNFLSSIVSLS